MNAEQLFAAIGGIDDDLIDESDERASPRTWAAWGALAACLVLVAGIGMVIAGIGPLRLPVGGMGSAFPGAASTSGAAGGGAMSGDAAPGEEPGMTNGAAWQGASPVEPESSSDAAMGSPTQASDGGLCPLAPLALQEDCAGLTAERHVELDFSPWPYVLVTDTCTLTNTTDEDRTVTALYPCAGSLPLSVTVEDADAQVHEQDGRYASFTLTIPAGQSVTAAVLTRREADGGCTLDTGLGSGLTFTRLTASIAHADGLELVADELGFDLENGVVVAELDPERALYFLEAAPRAGS